MVTQGFEFARLNWKNQAGSFSPQKSYQSVACCCFAAGDTAAMAFIRAFSDMGLRIPEQQQYKKKIEILRAKLPESPLDSDAATPYLTMTRAPVRGLFQQ